jgi:hypothetical protein
LVGLEEGYAEKTLFLLSLISDRFFVSLSKQIDSGETQKMDYSHFITVKSVFTIIRTTLEFIRNNSSNEDDQLKPFDAFKASLSQFFKALLSPQLFELYKLIFQ